MQGSLRAEKDLWAKLVDIVTQSSLDLSHIWSLKNQAQGVREMQGHPMMVMEIAV